MGSGWQECQRWSFESGTLEGFVKVDTRNSISVSVSPDSYEGSYALQCSAYNADGYAQALLDFPVPHDRIAGYRIEYWVKTLSEIDGRFNHIGASVVDAEGTLIAQILTHSTQIFFTDTVGNFLNVYYTDTWYRHVIEWWKNTGVIDHYVYLADGQLQASTRIFRAESKGKIPTEIRCHVRAWRTVSGWDNVHRINYDNITVSAMPSRRHRAAWMNMERPAVL